MLRATLLALGLASAAAENCGGSLSLDPRYCVGTVNNDGVTRYCDSTAILEGETVPLRIRVTNNANYENLDADTIYVPGEIVGGKTMQIVFACADGTRCDEALGDILAQDTTPPAWDDAIINAVGPVYGGQPAKFEMGACPGPFSGVNHCEKFGNAGSACGCVTVSEEGKNIPLIGDETIDIGMIFMKAVKYYAGSFVVHVSADQGILRTTGGVCTPDELTASGSGTAQAEYYIFSPPPPPPPPSPPRDVVKYACAIYNKCHSCDMLPPGACLYAGPEHGVSGPCIGSCDDVPDEYLFNKKWGACSSACPVSVSKDPHLHLPHGGRADFRGKDDTVFNLLSAKDVAFNVRFEKSDFAWASRLVHGTKMAAGYWVVTTSSGKELTVEYAAEKFDPVAIVREAGHSDVQARPGTPALVVDDVTVSMVGKTLTVRTGKWVFTATTSSYPFGKLETNKNKVLLDVAVMPLYDPDTDPVAPHGILGQSYDGDKIAVDGKLDEQKTGESTTAAQAEGAIEGTWEDYIVPSKFTTDFKYSRFGLAKAAPRDVSKLTGTKRAATADAVGVADMTAALAPSKKE